MSTRRMTRLAAFVAAGLITLGASACSSSDDQTSPAASATPKSSASSTAPLAVPSNAPSSPPAASEEDADTRAVCTAAGTEQWASVAENSDNTTRPRLATLLGVTVSDIVNSHYGIVSCQNGAKIEPWQHVRVQDASGEQSYGTACMMTNFKPSDAVIYAMCVKPGVHPSTTSSS